MKAARAMTVVSTSHSNRCMNKCVAEGAVKELKAKIDTMRHSTEMGLIPETHDSLARLATLAAATNNWFRPGLDGKTPYEQRARWDRRSGG